MPENPHSNILFDHVDGFEFIIVFLGSKFDLFSLTLQGGQLLSTWHSAVVTMATGINL